MEVEEEEVRRSLEEDAELERRIQKDRETMAVQRGGKPG
jgi:hypothetical protein